MLARFWIREGELLLVLCKQGNYQRPPEVTYFRYSSSEEDNCHMLEGFLHCFPDMSDERRDFVFFDRVGGLSLHESNKVNDEKAMTVRVFLFWLSLLR